MTWPVKLPGTSAIETVARAGMFPPFRWMVFVSAVRRYKPSECEATRQRHSSVGCLFELVRADSTKEVVRHHDHPTRAKRRPPDPSLSERSRVEAISPGAAALIQGVAVSRVIPTVGLEPFRQMEGSG